MQMEPQVSLDHEASFHLENLSSKDGDCSVTTPTLDHVVPKQPVKKPTRQWAAWTHQEEESFFNALRQVGKNFEKITCRVQSKNKDQVRHYYYRLVRRMNKLLGPELCLDAKNSKDTNAAMLRWWSLLEKYSCKASKLHLKPRRLKLFIETLEHQLLKDRKRNIHKRSSQGGNCSTSAPPTVSNQGRLDDSHAVETVLIDGQNILRLGSGKGSSLRRNVNIDFKRCNLKGDISLMKPSRQRRKPGTVSAAVYKRWEKAAIAGVSLVADAAEHLERTATDEVVEHFNGSRGLELVGKDVSSLMTFPHNLFEKSAQTSTKLKLQLFPIDEGTRRALEKENHNPHLELTLSSRKKISSVLEHLNRKWGSSSMASGEIILCPYCVQRENMGYNQKWTQDSVLSAADVYALIGSPPVFRLRYGWFHDVESVAATFQAPSAPSTISCGGIGNSINEQYVDSAPVSMTHCESEKLVGHSRDQEATVKNIFSPEPSSTDPNTNLVDSSDHAPNMAWQRREPGCGAIMRQAQDVDDPRPCNGIAFSAGEWADSLTNISVGDLLSEASHNIDANCINPPPHGSSHCLQQSPFSCDSFDAAIAAHIYKHQSKTGFQQASASHASSIWDAEVTCDAFSFPKNTVTDERVQNASRSASPEAHKQIAEASQTTSGAAVEELPEVEEPTDDDPMDECHPLVGDNSAKDLTVLTDMYWPDSLGPLDLDIPSGRYQTDDLILSDSLSGLNRLIASSLDAFQNCSFFGLDKKESDSTVEARETGSFASDYKIGSEV